MPLVNKYYEILVNFHQRLSFEVFIISRTILCILETILTSGEEVIKHNLIAYQSIAI